MQKTLEFRRQSEPENGKAETIIPTQEERTRLRLMAREVLGDVENLLAQHIELSKLEVQKSMRFVKTSLAMFTVATFLSIVGLVSLLRALALKMADAFDWTPATAEFVNGLLIFAVAGIMVYIGVKAAQKLSQLPHKLTKQWKEEWQWLRKNL